MLVLIVVLFVVIALVFFILKKRGGSSASDRPWPFYAKKVLTQPEQILYHRLVTTLPENIVLAQVQLSRVLGVKKGFNNTEWNNRINRMSLDFVVCLKDSTVVTAIELDDRSHEKARGIERDAKKAKALSSADIKLVRWQVNALPDAATIRQTLSMQQGNVASKREIPLLSEAK